MMGVCRGGGESRGRDIEGGDGGGFVGGSNILQALWNVVVGERGGWACGVYCLDVAGRRV